MKKGKINLKDLKIQTFRIDELDSIKGGKELEPESLTASCLSLDTRCSSKSCCVANDNT